MTDDENGRGKYQTGIDDEEYVEALRSLGPSSTPEIAEEVGVPRRSAYDRLRDLEDQGRVESQKVGTANLWKLIEA